MSEEKVQCPTKLLSDAPTKDDAFGHVRIAESIAQLVKGETGGKCIGLVGSWGSGKSSVVEILKDKVRDTADGDVGVFVFDAWAHQGDPLRRTFLEQLIEYLGGQNWLPEDEKWAEEKRDELSQRRQTAHVWKESVLTTAGAIFALLLLMLPLAYQMLVMSISSTKGHPIAETFGFAFSFAPLAAVAAVGLWWRHKDKERESDEGESDKRANVWSLIVKNSREEHWSNTVRTPDPTSVEFQSVFEGLLSRSLKVNNRKLLVVIDNLDRVEVGDALAIWSTMRTFFDFDSRARQEWLNRLWLLVPFDEGSVEKLWAGRATSQVAEDSPNSIGFHAASGVSELTKSFTDKTFQVTFRVARPVLSNWHSFLISQLKLAFPAETHNDDFHWIYRIYDLRAVEGWRAPTPREIKLFVNSVGALHRQWQDTIPLPVQAFYAVLRKQAPDLGSDLAVTKDGDILGTIPVDMLGEDWRVWLAAIHFNVPIEEAMQVTMEGRLQAALSSDKSGELETLAEIRGFDQALEKIAERAKSVWADKEAGRLAIAAARLSQIPDSASPSRIRAWSLMCEAASNTRRWPGLDAQVADGIIQLWKRQPSAEFTANLLASVSESLGQTSGEPEAAQIDNWLKGAERIVAALRTDREQAVQEHFRVTGTPKTYLKTVTLAMQPSGTSSICEFLLPRCSPSDIMKELGKSMDQGDFAKPVADAALLLEKLHNDWPWKDLVHGALSQRLRTPGQLDISALTALLTFLVYLSTHREEAAQTLKDLTLDGFVAHHLNNAASDPKAATLCLYPLLRELPGGETPKQASPQTPAGMQKFNQIVRSADPSIVAAFSDLLVNLGEVDFLFEVVARASNPAPFVHAVLKRIAERRDGHVWIRPERIIGSRKLLREACGQEGFDSLVKGSARNASLVDALKEEDFDLDLVGLYMGAMDAAPAESSLAEFVVEGLGELSEDRWVEELSAESNTIGLLLSLLGAGNSPRLGMPFEDALIRHAEMLLKEETEVEKFNEEWPSLLTAMDEGLAQATLRRILRSVCESSEPTVPVLELYGDQLAEPSTVAEEGELIMFDGAPHFLERENSVELGWLLAVLKNNPEMLPSTSSSAQADFKSRLKEALQADKTDAEVSEILDNLGKLAELNLEEEETEPEGEGPPGGE